MSSENAASSVISALGGGSGVDFLKLARDLTDAEKAPKENRLTLAKEESEAKISAVAVLQYNVSLFIDSLNGLNDADELSSPQVTSSDTANVSIDSAANGALAGSYQVSVSQLAASQRNMSLATGLASDTAINGGSSFTITIAGDDGTSLDVDVSAGKDSLAEIATAINAASLSGRSKIDHTIATDIDSIEAQLNTDYSGWEISSVNGVATTDTAADGALSVSDSDVLTFTNSDGGDSITITVDSTTGSTAAKSPSNPYRATAVATGLDGTDVTLVLEGASGANHGFTLSSTSASDQGADKFINGLSSNEVQAGQDARFSVNGLSVTRASNQIIDVIDGVSFTLEAVASANIKVVGDHSTLKDKLKGLVESYNDIQLAAKELADPASEEELVGGALARDKALIRSVKDAVYDAITSTSSVTSGNIEALRDIGISLTKSGDLSFDETVFDDVASSSFNDISIMLTAGTSDQSIYDPNPQGLAIDAIERLDILTDEIDGLFVSKATNEQLKLVNYELELQELDVTMEKIYQRYVRQFAIMETLVSGLNSTRDSMGTTWENMSKNLWSD
ncbi:MAG: flagellar filament capping protein FliD [Pseudomonadota bacterium]|nr:flagellar filament capping protein FliD [Pseudomonadota bacterium]